MKAYILLLFPLLFISHHPMAQSVWYEIDTPTDRDLRCIDFVNEDIGYAAGNEVLIKTTDGGATWSIVQIDSINGWVPAGWNATSIDFFTEDHGRMVIGDYASFVETFDGGVHWNAIGTANFGLCFFGTSFFFDEDNGFVGGHGCFESAIIDRMVDGEWTTTTLPPIFTGAADLVTGIDFVDDLNGLACTNAGRILRTVDGGQVWDSIPLEAEGAIFTDIVHADPLHVYATYKSAAGSNEGWGVMSSTDGGSTFGFDNETATFYDPDMNAAYISPAGGRYLGGQWNPEDTTGIIIYKEDDIWSNYTPTSPIHGFSGHSDTIVLAVGNAGAIYSNVEPGALTVSGFTSESIRLFPNPAHDHLEITLGTGLIAPLDIEVYDIEGKMIVCPFVLDMNSCMIDIQALDHGTYVIRLLTSERSFEGSFVKH